MKCTENGIGLSKAELAALLAFAHPVDEEGKSSHMAVVYFRISEDHCWAYATDGHRCVEADGESDTKHADGEWYVRREFLDAAAKLLDARGLLRLGFSGASLTEARVENEFGDEVAVFQWPRDASPRQTSFPNVRGMFHLPSHSTACRATTLNTGFLADLKKVAKAAGRSGIDVFHPADPKGATYFRCSGDPTTVWTAVVLPMGESATVEQGEEGPGDGMQQVIEQFQEGLGENTTATIEVTGETPVTIRGKAPRRRRRR